MPTQRAARLGYRFVLVLSGSTHSADGIEPVPDEVAPDLASAVERALA